MFSKIYLNDLLLIILAVSMQFFISPTFFGQQIRISASDMLLPFLVPLIFIKIKRNGLSYIDGPQKSIWMWLFCLSAWLTFELINGIFYTGHVQLWGLVNKYFGWFVLLVFFISGAVIGKSADAKSTTKFIKTMVVCAIIIGVFDYWPYIQTIRGPDSAYWRIEGFSNNPNSYGVLTAVTFILHLAFCCFKKELPNWKDIVSLSVLGALIVFSGSRSAMLGALLCLIFVFFLNQKLTKNLTYRLTIGTILLTCIIVNFTISINTIENKVLESAIVKKYFSSADYDIGVSNDALSNKQPKVVNTYSYVSRADISKDSGVSHRLAITKEALKLWKGNPIIGVGLGGFTWSELQNGRTANIHNTALWLLVEMGLVGLGGFALFFALCFKSLLNAVNHHERNVMCLASLLMLIVFFGASIGMEVMYQRYIWFILGWGLSKSTNKN